MKIVIVSDSEADRERCRLLLQATDTDFEVAEAEDAPSAMEACGAISPDCVLIGPRLVDMSGLQFLQLLVSGDGQKEPFATVMLTDLGRTELASAALAAGAHDHLAKDHLDAETLSLAIRKAITRCDLKKLLESERSHMAGLIAEKEILLQEIHHRVKNNLAVVASLLSLQAHAIKDEQLASALRESQHRVEAMAHIHEHLQATADPRRIDLAEHAKVLATSMFDSYGIKEEHITWRVEMRPLQLGLKQAVPAGLILSELISNALQHAFPQRRIGSIVIEGARRQGRIELAVSDNGIGISAGIERPKSLGMQIVKTLVRQLKGTFQVESSQPARFHVSFPEEKDEKSSIRPDSALETAAVS